MSREEETGQAECSTSIFTFSEDAGVRQKSRACDICRRRKVRCDGDSKQGTRCTNCRTSDLVCTYFQNLGKTATKRVANPPSSSRQRIAKEREDIKEREDRLIKLQTLLSKYLPDIDFSQDLDSIIIDKEIEPSPTLHIVDHAVSLIRRMTQRIDMEKRLDDSLLLVDSPSAPDYMQGRFFGKSSSAMFIKELVHLKAEYTGVPLNIEQQQQATLTRRPDLWLLRPWEQQTLVRKPEKPQYSFPDDDLLVTLTDLYFEHVNLFSPLLHRPTLEKHLTEKFHLENKSFGAVVLLVCAIGAKFSDDPRVFMDEYSTPLTRGWKWFNQVHQAEQFPLAPASLYDVQACSLTAEFLRGASTPGAAWTIVGVGMRLAQDVGAHRWRTFGQQPKSATSELWTRAWWCLVILDRVASAVTGRPCISQEYDFDVGLPTDCDDEYWDHPDPKQAWKQPEGKPSKMSFFISFIGQSQILASTLDFLYATDKTKDVVYGVEKPEGYEHRLVSEMDSAINKWIATIPTHLRWDPKNQNLNWFRQSLVLYAELYLLQILIHRPFIAASSKPTILAMSSLAICTNAARACSHILNIQEEKYINVVYRLQYPVFSSAVVLLLSVWGGKRAGLATNSAKEMQDVHKCMEMLRSTENKVQASKALRFILIDLASAGDLPLPDSDAHCSKQAAQYSQAPDAPNQMSRQTSALEDVALAGSRRRATGPQDSIFCAAPDPKKETQPPQADTILLQSLPLYSDDLARLPLFSQSMPPPPASAEAQDLWPRLSQNGTGEMPLMDMPSSNLFESVYDQQANTGAFSGYEGPDPNNFSSHLAYATLASDPLGLEPMPTGILDPDILALWSCAPTSFESGGDQWDAYVSNMNEIQMSSVMGNMHMQQ